MSMNFSNVGSLTLEDTYWDEVVFERRSNSEGEFVMDGLKVSLFTMRMAIVIEGVLIHGRRKLDRSYLLIHYSSFRH